MFRYIILLMLVLLAFNVSASLEAPRSNYEESVLDQNHCATKFDGYQKHKCFDIMAKNNRNALEVCPNENRSYHVTDYRTRTDSYKDKCFAVFSRIQGDSLLCDNIEKQEAKEWCKSGFGKNEFKFQLVWFIVNITPILFWIILIVLILVTSNPIRAINLLRVPFGAPKKVPFIKRHDLT